MSQICLKEQVRTTGNAVECGCLRCAKVYTRKVWREEGGPILTQVKRRLSEGSEELMPRRVTATNFLSAVVDSLQWDFRAHITEILNDQWSGIAAEDYDGFRTWIECDLVEHGLAATWLAFAERSLQTSERAPALATKIDSPIDTPKDQSGGGRG